MHEEIGPDIQSSDAVQPHPGGGNSELEGGADERNVAVIAIHGVGQHLSGASADAVSTLLMSIGRENVVTDGGTEDETSPPYSGFVASPISVPLRPIQAPQRFPNEANFSARDKYQPFATRESQPLARSVGSRAVGIISLLWRMFDERRGYLAEARADAVAVPYGYNPEELRPGEPDRGEFAYQFMLTQVAGYQGEVDRNFQTVRLEGKRAPASPAANIHIYDAHYSDLTKPQSNILSFFFAFYQLLFHLADLSLRAVYFAEAENSREDPKHQLRWRIKSSVSAIAVRSLTMLVPCLNVILLLIGASALITKASALPAPKSYEIAVGFAAVVGLLATFYILWRLSVASPLRPFSWAVMPFLGSAIGLGILSGIAYLYAGLVGLRFGEALLLWCWLLVAGMLLGLVAAKFDELRPGAFWLTVFLYVMNSAFFLGYLIPQAKGQSASHLQVASLWAVQSIFAQLSVSWVVCLLAALVNWPLGIVCLLGIANADNARRARAIAAFRTGRFAFAVPAVLFLIVTTALWSGIVVYGSKQLNAFGSITGLPEQPWLAKGWPSWFIPPMQPTVQWVEDALLKSESSDAQPRCPEKKSGGGLTAGRSKQSVEPAKCCCQQPQIETPAWSHYLTGLLLVSVTPALPLTILALALTLLLLIWAVFPSVLYEIFPNWTQYAPNHRIQGLGSWLSRGVDNVAVLTRILWLAIVPLPLFFYALDWGVLHPEKFPWLDSAYCFVNYASSITLLLITVTGVIVTVSGATLIGFSLKYFTSILDTILDVDNYLRTSPLDETPRARIAERCVSLLRYIAARRDVHNRPYYSKVIFVAHSLGSMVTTDLLRYLERSAKSSPDVGLERYQFRGAASKSGDPRLPIYVFSMGSPLRQLLNRFFPHLYWWVCDVPDNSLSPVSAALNPPMPPIAATALPRSDEMNVVLWANAYRSGDYIGRSLWLGQWLIRNAADNPRAFADVGDAGPPQACLEMCIGLGAHTHYWDRSAPEIAYVLDQLILA